MRVWAERAYFRLCRTLGHLIRAGRYSETWEVRCAGETRIRKRRRGYAPILVWMGGLLVRVLDTGVRVLPQRQWEERERQLYRRLRDASVLVTTAGVLTLPRLRGETLAAVLEDPRFDAAVRVGAIELATVALVALHRLGLTHGDAMAENVMVDLGSGVANWFDFETLHAPDRPLAWCRADDVRALLATCLLRSPRESFAATLELISDTYADEAVIRLVAASFASVWRRPLAFHLGQAGLSFRSHREIAGLLRTRSHG